MERDEEWNNELKDFSAGESGKRNITAPDGYFNQLPDAMIQRWQNEKQQPVTKKIGLPKMIAAAAIVTGLAIGITMLNKQSVEVSSAAEISTADAYEYILENIDDFAPLILENNPQAEADIQPIPEQANPQELKPHDVEEYLLEEMESEDFETLF
jgi:hypothetical protein